MRLTKAIDVRTPRNKPDGVAISDIAALIIATIAMLVIATNLMYGAGPSETINVLNEVSIGP